jgi:hypothetical protein
MLTGVNPRSVSGVATTESTVIGTVDCTVARVGAVPLVRAVTAKKLWSLGR